jgi:hypothetical protein
MATYKQIGIPESVAAESNAGTNSTAVLNRLLGIPSATPQTTFTAAVVAAMRSISGAVGAMIDTVNRKVTVTDDADSIDAIDAAADAGASVATLTSSDPTEATPEWTIDDQAELEAIYGETPATILALQSLAGNKSPESILNALLNKAGQLEVNVLVAVNQDAGTIKVAKFANNGAQTTAADGAREEVAAPAVFVTVEMPAPEVEVVAGPNWGL